MTAPGGPCATTCGACPPPRWCAGSWAAGRPWRPRGAGCLGPALAPSSWMTCGARAARPAWGGATTSACRCTTAGTRRTPGPSAQVWGPLTPHRFPPGSRACPPGGKAWGQVRERLGPVRLEFSQCQHSQSLSREPSDSAPQDLVAGVRACPVSQPVPWPRSQQQTHTRARPCGSVVEC